MTIAICLKVGDGVVLGTDSASSLIGENNEYYNVYSTAEKTINLVKGLPVGMMTYGLGAMMGLSIGSLARDLRERLSGQSPQHIDWALDPENYTIEEVAGRVREFFYEELYRVQFNVPIAGAAEDAGAEQGPPDDAREDEGIPGTLAPKFPLLGFTVAGFSAADYYAQVWTIEVNSDGSCASPRLLYKREDAGVVDFRGQPEALYRLVYGWSSEAQQRLIEAGLSPDVADQLLISRTELAHPGMPLQDAIDLVRYLAETTVGYVRFKTGAPTVSPPIDIAAITRHQGFKWVARKHYYSRELNPASEG